MIFTQVFLAIFVYFYGSYAYPILCTYINKKHPRLYYEVDMVEESVSIWPLSLLIITYDIIEDYFTKHGN